MASQAPQQLALTDQLLPYFKLGRTFKDNVQRINSMDFRADGEFLVTAGNDESIHLYNVNTAKMVKTVFVKRYGVNIVRFTHHANTVLTASNNSNGNDDIRYLSLHDNRYLRYFKGHTNKVVSIEVSPVDDCVLSGSIDKTVRLWDTRTNLCQGLLRCDTSRSAGPIVSYDPSGVIFAASVGKGKVNLYDVRSFDKGPFATFHSERQAGIVSLDFSPDGKYLLANNQANTMLLLDSFDGKVVRKFNTRPNQTTTCELQPTFSPDGQYVMAGSEEGNIHVFRTDSGQQLSNWAGHSLPTKCVKFNPKRLMVASADTKLGFWIPSMSGLLAVAQASSSSSSSH
jgi:COMPASS component SWD2